MAPHRLGALLIGVGAVLLGAFSRGVWVTASYSDTLAGGGVAHIRGAEWSTETTAVALLLFVAAIGAFALRRTGRRLTSIVAALASLGAAVAPTQLLLRGADPERVHALLTAGLDTAQTASTTQATVVSEWAETTSTSVTTLLPLLSLLGCLVSFAGAVVVVARPGTDAPKQNKYEKEVVRRERLADDLETNPDSGRVMWDALDADIDPTDTSTPRP